MSCESRSHKETVVLMETSLGNIKVKLYDDTPAHRDNFIKLPKTIATKYPNVTRAFFDDKNMDVRIIKIEGSVELAPLVGLSDGIVDIVETGSTLKANGLEVIEWVTEISARLIANTASLKLRKAEIEELQKKLEAVTK